METSVLLRHQIINGLMAQHTENVADAAVNLWEQMALQIVAFVGEAGFDSLYGRSVFHTRIKFPWLAAGALPPQAEQRFAGLKVSLEKQTPAQAGEANRLLLINFTDILSSLIGEQLTTHLLRSAWGSEELLMEPLAIRLGGQTALHGHSAKSPNDGDISSWSTPAKSLVMAEHPNDATDKAGDEKLSSRHPKELKNE